MLKCHLIYLLLVKFKILENRKEQAWAEMCQAHIKLWFGLVRLGLAWDVLAWLGIVWHGLLKLNYQVSLLTQMGAGLGGENQN